MNIYTNKRRWKLFLLISAVAIGVFTLWYTQNLVEKLKENERERMALWADAMRELTITDNDPNTPSFVFEIIKNNTTIPVILTDANDTILYYRNINVSKQKEEKVLYRMLNKMKSDSSLFVIDLGKGEKQYLYYTDSILIRRLSWFPIIQLLVVSVFIFVAYLAFSGARKAEQDQVWAGMAKETAHQLGTPTSSLLGWIDVLKLKMKDEDEMLSEMSKDINRLQTITDRFSKIGSNPEMKDVKLNDVILNSIEYLKRRTSKKTEFVLNMEDNVHVKINPVLFEWTLENVCKNAIDAMNGEGKIEISLKKGKENVIVDIKDNGKGIAKSRHKTVFEPGFTTKKRGWGLGLSLTKRIIEQYHKGKIFVKESEPGKGTTFRILLKNEA